MPKIHVEGYDSPVNFPDDMSNEQIADALKRMGKKETLSASEGMQNPLGFSKEFRDKILEHGENAKNFGENAKNFGKGYAQGLANIPSGAINSASSLTNYLLKNFQVPVQIPEVPSFNFAPEGDASTAGNALSFLTGTPFLRATGAVGKLGSHADKIPYIGNKIKQAAETFQNPTPKSAVSGNVLKGMAYDPANPLAGGLMGLISAPISPTVFNALKERARPENMFRGPLSAQELQENLARTRGTNTPLGHVVESPFLNSLDELLQKIPGSEAQKAAQEIPGQMSDKANEILSGLSKGIKNPEESGEMINEDLKDTYKKNRAANREIYNKADDRAKEIGLQLTLPKFGASSKKLSDDIESMKLLNGDPEIKSIFNRISGYKQPVKNAPASKILDVNGKPIESSKKIYPSLTEANLLKAHLRELGQRAASSPDLIHRQRAGVFTKLSNLLKQDIEEGIAKTGDSQLKSSYNNAETHYAENVGPFHTPEIYPFVNGGKDSDTLLSSFVKTGPDDRANLISGLMSKLPERSQNALQYAYLSRALDHNGKINALDFEKLYNRGKLGPRQFKELFPKEETRNALNDYSKLIDYNRKTLTKTQAPEDNKLHLLDFLMKQGLGAALKMGGERAIGNNLTSPAIRRVFVKKLSHKPPVKGKP